MLFAAAILSAGGVTEPSVLAIGGMSASSLVLLRSWVERRGKRGVDDRKE
jgi:hypothetical protein